MPPATTLRLFFAALLLLAFHAVAQTPVPDAATIKADHDSTLLKLEMDCSANFPQGNASTAATVTECNITIRRLDDWHRRFLRPFEDALVRFGEAAENFRLETERLNRSGQLTREQYDERIHQQYVRLVDLVRTPGALYQGYQTWKAKMQTAHTAWKNRQTELTRRPTSHFASR